jgi:hypothetical protein
MNKIVTTGVKGLDIILNGGIIYEKEVVIVLRGGRGIYKTLLGMQMMLGIQHYFMEEYNETSDKNPIRFYSLNKSEETLNKMFGGIVVSSEVESIKKKNVNSKVDRLKEYLNGVVEGNDVFEQNIRRQIETFDSNLGRFFRGKVDSSITIKNDIRKDFNLSLKSYDDTTSQSNYLASDLKDFSEMMKDVEGQSNKEPQQACIVVDGLSRMTEEELRRLPLESLEKELRKRSKVSILILNDKETLRNLDADIIIDMQRRIDPVHNYTYHELSVVKNVKGQFAFGWHKYKPMNGLVYVYPSIHKLLSQQYSVDNTFIQAINTNARYAQSFVENDVEPTFPNDNPEEENVPTTKDEILLKLITPHEAEKCRVTSIIGNHNTFKRFLVSVSILNSLLKEHEVFVLLLNEKRKGMIELIDKIRHDAGIDIDRAKKVYEHLFFWEVRMGCISPEELISFVMEYIQLHKDNPEKRNRPIEIFVIDLGTIEQCFPMLSNESLFVPTLSTLCRENKVDLHLVCNKHFSQRSVVCTVADNLICTRRNREDDNNQLTMLLEKNDFGPRYNSKVFELVVKQVYGEGDRFNVGTNSEGMVVFKKDINEIPNVVTSEIPTTKDYWRKTVNVVTL